MNFQTEVGGVVTYLLSGGSAGFQSEGVRIFRRREYRFSA